MIVFPSGTAINRGMTMPSNSPTYGNAGATNVQAGDALRREGRARPSTGGGHRDRPRVDRRRSSTKIAPAGTHWKEIDELRERHRFFWNTDGPGYWVVTRFEDIREAFQSPETFCNRSIVATDPDPQYRFLPSFIDPPEHMKYRQIMNKWFAPAAVARLAPTLERIARGGGRRSGRERRLRLHVDVRRPVPGEGVPLLDGAVARA